MGRIKVWGGDDCVLQDLEVSLEEVAFKWKSVYHEGTIGNSQGGGAQWGKRPCGAQSWWSVEDGGECISGGAKDGLWNVCELEEKLEEEEVDFCCRMSPWAT